MCCVRGYCKPRGSRLRSSASGCVRSRIEQFLSDARVVKERAGVRGGQIVLQQRAQVGFVIDIHFEVRIAAMVNLRAMSDGFGAMFGKAAGAKVRREESRRSTQDRVGSGAVARRNDNHRGGGAIYREQFVDVIRLHEREIEWD